MVGMAAVAPVESVRPVRAVNMTGHVWSQAAALQAVKGRCAAAMDVEACAATVSRARAVNTTERASRQGDAHQTVWIKAAVVMVAVVSVGTALLVKVVSLMASV